jgi:hypothetical protein
MARTKSKTQQTKVALSRLLQDEDVQKQLRTAALRLREAWSRASRRPASKAVGDKKVYSKVRDAATSLVAAGRGLRKKPEPKRTGRKVAVGAAVAGGAAYAVKKKRGGGGGNGGSEQFSPEPTGPVAAPTPPTPVTSA